MPFTIERNDLAHMAVDAVVVAANEQLQITGGVGAAVAQVAGGERLQAACDAIGFCPTGSAVATPGFDLPARFVVHAVGPVWRDGSDAERELLSSSYREALACAAREGARSVALPLLSSGTYGCPAEISFTLALEAVRAFLETHDVDIRIVLYNRAAVAAGLAAYGDIASYIDDRYVDEHGWMSNLERPREAARAPMPGPAPLGAGFAAPPAVASAPPEQSRRRRLSVVDRLQELREAHVRRKDEAKAEIDAEGGQLVEEELAAPCDTGAFPQIFMDAVPMPSLDKWLDEIDEPFSTTLLALIDARGLTDAQVYKRANMSRQLFSKIRSDAAYRPTKKTVLALAVALGLNLEETSDLLRRAGFALSHSSKADIIVEYFIVRGQCDIFAINEALYAFDQPLL